MPFPQPDASTSFDLAGFAPEQAPTISLPRNPLHLDLLRDNIGAVDLVLYRDAHLKRAVEARCARSLYIGRERKLARNDLDLPAIRRANALYYTGVKALFDRLMPGKLILFLHTEPLEQFILSFMPAEKVEIWEEGLMTYLPLNGAGFSFARRAGQALNGFHVANLFRPAISGESYRMRDRFREGSLHIVLPKRRAELRQEALFVGQPVVQDHLTSQAAYLKNLRRIVALSPFPIRYLPHPREDDNWLTQISTEMDKQKFAVDPDRRGIIEHCADYRYVAHLSMFSTALLDIDRFESSYWIAPLFGFHKIGRQLASAHGLPVRLISTENQLRDRLAAAALQG